MNIRRLLLSTGFVLGIVGFSPAYAVPVVLNMNSLTANCSPSTGSPINLGQGYQVSFAAGSADVCSAGNPGVSGFTSNYLFNVGQPGVLTLDRIDGGTFDLNGFDFDHIQSPFGAPTALLVVESIALTSSLTTDGQIGTVESFAFSGFTGVTSVDISSFIFGIDNISVTGPDINVPEPTSMAIFGLGLIGFGIARRRRR